MTASKPAEIYQQLRHRALTLTTEQLELAKPPPVLAAIMEMAYPQAVATLAAVVDGTASLYFSNGGGIIGSGQHESPRREALKLVELAFPFLISLPSTRTFPLPQVGQVRFYIVTDAGVHGGDATEKELATQKHPLSPLFFQGHKLITQIRLADEQSRNVSP